MSVYISPNKAHAPGVERPEPSRPHPRLLQAIADTQAMIAKFEQLFDPPLDLGLTFEIAWMVNAHVVRVRSTYEYEGGAIWTMSCLPNAAHHKPRGIGWLLARHTFFQSVQAGGARSLIGSVEDSAPFWLGDTSETTERPPSEESA